MSRLLFRIAQPQDAHAIVPIYSAYVTDTAITFEYDAPTVKQFSARIEHTLLRYPYLILHDEEKLYGYAYANPFKPRDAYNWSVETTIYLAPYAQGKGYGNILYKGLEHILLMQGITNLNACITSAKEPYVSEASEKFHHKQGYSKVAHFTRCGYKFEQWFDMIWMEKFIAPHTVPPMPFTPFSELSHTKCNEGLAELIASLNDKS